MSKTGRGKKSKGEKRRAKKSNRQADKSRLEESEIYLDESRANQRIFPKNAKKGKYSKGKRDFERDDTNQGPEINIVHTQKKETKLKKSGRNKKQFNPNPKKQKKRLHKSFLESNNKQRLHILHFVQ